MSIEPPQRPHVPAISVAELIEPALDTIDEQSHAGTSLGPGAWPTGFEDLDILLGGLRPSLVHLAFGMPGVGTSTFALDCARATAQAGGTVLYLSGQSPRTAILDRILSAEARIPLSNLRRATLREEDWTKLAQSMAALGDWGTRFTIVDRPNRDFAALAESDLFERHWDLVVVDGVQLYTRATAPESLWAAHTRVAGDVKRAAMEHASAFLVTVSVNRRPTNRGDYGLAGPLTLPDIASSNAHASDADVVIGIHRDDLLDRESPRAGEADLMVLKNRYGPQSTIVIAFQGHYSRFMSIPPS